MANETVKRKRPRTLTDILGGEWKKQRGITEDHHDHNCRDNDCRAKGNISVIKEVGLAENIKKVFACSESGHVHICRSNLCNKYYCFSDNEPRCYFSGEICNWNLITLTKTWCESLKKPEACTENASCTSECQNYIRYISKSKNVFWCDRCSKIHICDEGNNCIDTADYDEAEDGFFCRVSKKKIKEESTIKMLYGQKWRKENEHLFFESVKEHKCGYPCVDGGSIVCINSRFNVYGCLVSGYVHACAAGEHACPQTFLTKEGIYVCLFSKAVSGVFYSRNNFLNISEQLGGGASCSYFVEKDQDEHGTELSDFDEDSQETKDEEITENYAKKNDSMMVVQQLLFEQEGQQLGESEELISALNMTDTVMKSRVPEPSPVFSVPQKKNRKQKRRDHQKDLTFHKNRYTLLLQAQKMLVPLIGNDSQKVSLSNQQKMNAWTSAFDATLKNEIKILKTKTLPTLKEIDACWDRLYFARDPIELSSASQRDRIEHYANVCVDLWQKVVETPYYTANKSKFRWKNHIIGTMYFLRSGLTLNHLNKGVNLEVVPKDPYLEKYLVNESNLNLVDGSLSKDQITAGRNHIKAALNSIPVPDLESLHKLGAELKQILNPPVIK